MALYGYECSALAGHCMPETCVPRYSTKFMLHMWEIKWRLFFAHTWHKHTNARIKGFIQCLVILLHIKWTLKSSAHDSALLIVRLVLKRSWLIKYFKSVLSSDKFSIKMKVSDKGLIPKIERIIKIEVDR